MAGSTTKKVYLRRLDSSLLEGYVSPQTYLRPDGVEVLTRSAEVEVVPYREIRAVYFVRDFGDFAGIDQKRVFGSRPKLDGLWVRLVFRDEEEYEGVVPNDLLTLPAQGVTFTPPEANSNIQRIFVPRQALKTIEVLGVVGAAARRRRAAPSRPQPAADQMGLFGSTTS